MPDKSPSRSPRSSISSEQQAENLWQEFTATLVLHWRDFITLLGGGVLGRALLARADHVIG
jgi:hypothetical protein